MTRTLWILSFIGLLGTAVTITACQPSSTSAPATPVAANPPPVKVAGPALFESWMKYEAADAKLPAAAGGEAYIDAVLGHQVFMFPPQGLPTQQARELLLDDDKLLLSCGRRLWGQEVTYQPGMSGKFCYLHSSFCSKRLFDVTFFLDGKPVVIYDNAFGIERFPSHTAVKYFLEGVNVEEKKFITYDDRAVSSMRLQSTDKKAHELDIEVLAPYLPMPRGEEVKFPLLGAGAYQGSPLFIYLDAPGFTKTDTGLIHLRRHISLPADGSSTQVQIAASYENEKRSNDNVGIADDLFEQHRRANQKWYADNVPYFDASDAAFKRLWYYRAWIVRFNMTEANTPDLSGYRFYEGKLGFDNPITFATPVHMKELTYLRDPAYGMSQIENAYRNLAPTGAIQDPPGSPYWGESYSHWAAAALLEFSRVHPIPTETLRKLLPAMAGDVRAWVTTFDEDSNGLPQSDRPRITGYDLDILSYWYFNDIKLSIYGKPPALERVDFASFVFANASALVEFAKLTGNLPIEREFTEIANKIRTATLQNLWDPETQFFYPRSVDTKSRVPIRELHGFFPFTTQLAPDDGHYVGALNKLVDPNEFWAMYPPVITSLVHYKKWTWDMDGLTRNIAPHPISMGARTVLKAIKHYKQTAVTPKHFMDLMERYNALMLPRVNPYDPLWRPNVHEYYSKWEPNQSVQRPKPSDISHDFHSMYLSLIVEGVVGLTPRGDELIELYPMARDWDYFLIDRLRYRGKDLRIVWDRPDGKVRYDGIPEGFSLFIDGQQAFTQPTLDHVIYDPAARTVRTVDGPA